MSASYEKEVLALPLFGFCGGERTEFGGSQNCHTSESPEDCVFIKISELHPKHTELKIYERVWESISMKVIWVETTFEIP